MAQRSAARYGASLLSATINSFIFRACSATSLCGEAPPRLAFFIPATVAVSSCRAATRELSPHSSPAFSYSDGNCIRFSPTAPDECSEEVVQTLERLPGGISSEADLGPVVPAWIGGSSPVSARDCHRSTVLFISRGPAKAFRGPRQRLSFFPFGRHSAVLGRLGTRALPRPRNFIKSASLGISLPLPCRFPRSLRLKSGEGP